MRHQTTQELQERFAAIEAGAVDSWSNLWLVESLWQLGQMVALKLGPRDDLVVQLTELSTSAFDARAKDIPKIVTRLASVRVRVITKLSQRAATETERA